MNRSREEKRAEKDQEWPTDQREPQNMLLEVLERLARLEESQLALRSRTVSLVAEPPSVLTPTKDQNSESAT
jgi:hypothetical protein